MIKNLLYLTGGLVVGAIAGYFLGKRHAEEKEAKSATERLEAEKAYYEAKVETMRKELELSDQKRAFAEGVLKTTGVTTRGEEKAATATPDSPKDEDERQDDNDGRGVRVIKPPDDDTPAPYYEEVGGVAVYPSEPHKFPYIISEQEYTNTHYEYDKVTLFFYEGDEVITDDENEAVDDPVMLIGWEWINGFDKGDDPDVVYVRNSSISVDYEVIREHRRYVDMLTDKVL